MRPERYQLPLLIEFGGLPAQKLTPAPLTPNEGLIIPQDGLSRFVREVSDGVIIHTPADAADYLMSRIYTPFDQFDQEEIWSLLLNTKNRVTHEVMVYRGTLNSVHIRLAEIFKEAIRVNAAAFLLSHCHPSGEPSPSPEDVAVTEQIVQVGKMLEIPMLDHIVVGRGSFVSMKERRLGFR